MNDCKIYAEKGVQTDFAELSCSQDHDERLHPLSRKPGPSTHPVIDIPRPPEHPATLDDLDGVGAYTHFEMADTAFPGDVRRISAHPTTESQRLPRYGQLSHNRRTQMPLSSNRVVSLPETSPPHRANRTSGNTTRFVSMPERSKILDDPIRNSGDRQLEHSEHLNISLTSDTSLRRPPQTPSPPSSPDSVMIIGNNIHVPQAFLRPKAEFDNSETGGWIPWKSSPPKPIPALHGPLSLPYARCPSGAEGTIVEGEDLSHMIWGLESNSFHLTHAKSDSGIPHGHKNSPRYEISSRIPESRSFDSNHDFLAQNFRNQDVIDLCRPEFYAPSQGGRINRAQSHQFLRPYSSVSEDPLPFNRETQGSNIYDFIRKDSPIQLYPSSVEFSPTERSVWKAGLGLDIWKGLQDSGVPFLTDTSFPMVYGEPTYSLSEPAKTSQIYQTPRTVSANDVRFYDSQRYRSGIPTPSNTCSPQWSPRFGQAYFDSLSPEARYERVSTPRLSQFSSTTGMKQEGLNPDRMINPHHAHEQYHLRSDSLTPPIVDLDGKSGQRVNRGMDVPTVSLANVPTLGCHDNAYLISKNRSVNDRMRRKTGTAPPSPVSPDIRVNFSHQQPRSIPLTRLIQRRLSSVAEEETGADACPNGSPSPSLKMTFSNTTIYSKTGTGEGHMQEQKPGLLDAPTYLTDTAKQAHKPQDHSLRRIPTNIRELAGQGRKPSADLPAAINRFGGQREDDVESCVTNIKPNKSHRKRRAKK